MDSASGNCLLRVDSADGKPPTQISARCTPLADKSIRVVTDSCGTFHLHPITKRGPQDGLASLDGYSQFSSHKNCQLHATPFPDAWLCSEPRAI